MQREQHAASVVHGGAPLRGRRHVSEQPGVQRDARVRAVRIGHQLPDLRPDLRSVRCVRAVRLERRLFGDDPVLRSVHAHVRSLVHRGRWSAVPKWADVRFGDGRLRAVHHLGELPYGPRHLRPEHADVRTMRVGRRLHRVDTALLEPDVRGVRFERGLQRHDAGVRRSRDVPGRLHERRAVHDAGSPRLRHDDERVRSVSRGHRLQSADSVLPDGRRRPGCGKPVRLVSRRSRRCGGARLRCRAGLSRRDVPLASPSE